MPKFLEKVPEHAAKVAKKLADEAMGRLKVETHIVGDKEEDNALQRRLPPRGHPADPGRPLLGDRDLQLGRRSPPAGKSVRVPLVTLEGEELSEFDVREAIEGELKTLIPGFLTTVGVMSPDASKNPMAQMMGQRQPPPEEFARDRPALEGEFDVRKIDLTDGKPIPRQIAVLVDDPARGAVGQGDLRDRPVRDARRAARRVRRRVSFDLEKRDGRRGPEHDQAGRVRGLPEVPAAPRRRRRRRR